MEVLEPHCRITGLNDRRLLVASHIKPWRVCQTSDERLDGANGLLLAPHVDRLFDLGLISFEQDGRVIVSTEVKAEVLKCLGIFDNINGGVGRFLRRQEVYLAYHRQNIFLI